VTISQVLVVGLPAKLVHQILGSSNGAKLCSAPEMVLLGLDHHLQEWLREVDQHGAHQQARQKDPRAVLRAQAVPPHDPE